MMHRSVRFLLIIIHIFLTVTGILLLVVGGAEFARVKSLFDLLAPDGNLEGFTPLFHDSVRLPGMILGCLLLLSDVLILLFPKTAGGILTAVIDRMLISLKALRCDSLDLWKWLTHLGFDRWEWLLLLGFILYAIASRWVWIEKPMMHDESYSFIAFAKRPLLKIISDYHLPNNHILNSIFIHILYRVFGNPCPVIVRFPAFLAGVITVPLVYIWSRKTYGRSAAILSAGLAAFCPQLIVQSTNGRGYMLMGAFTIMMLGLGEIVRRHKNRAGWLLLVLVTVLNFYTMPIALYPFGILSLWLLLSALAGDIGKAYASLVQFIRCLFLYGLGSGVLTFFLHTPIFLFGTGWQSFFNNPFVRPLSWLDFRDSILIRLSESLAEWTTGMPIWLTLLLGAGLLASILLHYRRTAWKVPLQVCIVVGLVVIFILQRPNPWARIWTYLIPVLFVFSAGGLVFLVEAIFTGRSARVGLTWFTSILTITVLGLGILQMRDAIKYHFNQKGQVEMLTLWLEDQLTSEDVVLTSMGFGPAFWYYFDRYGLPLETLVDLKERTEWDRAFLLVDGRENQSYPEIILPDGLVRLEDCPAGKVETIHTLGNFTVYRCIP